MQVKLVQSNDWSCDGCFFSDGIACINKEPHCTDETIYKLIEEGHGGSAEEYDTVSKPKHSHYFKNVSHLEWVDAYRIADLFEVTNPCIQHALKKLLVTGNRGHKDVATDVQDVIDTLERWKEMQRENLEENNFDA